MILTTKKKIIPHRVLNEISGELETKEFEEVKTSRKTIKGGFTMVYKTYDDAMIEIVKSNLDLKIFIHIRDLFTHQNTDVHISPALLAKSQSTAKSKIQTILKRMIESDLLHKTSPGNYRLNPFMYLPYKSNGVELQLEWIELTK